MAESSAKTEQDWFENVENFRQLRGGRRAGTLNEVATGTAKVAVDEAERKFMKEFTEASTKQDPLESLSGYVAWFEEHFPSGKQKYFYPILYKICTTYCTMEAYKNDERLLKLWLNLAENFPESGLAVMEFAFSKGSCRQLAKFYINWSRMYQSIGWWNKAREKLQLGMKMCAIPLDSLHQASDELESCVMRVTCQQPDEDQPGEEDEASCQNNLEMSRETLGKLRGIGRKHFAPILRVPQGPPGTLSSSSRSKPTKKDKSNLDRFDIFSDDQKPCQAAASDFQTPICPRVGKKSRIALQLASDLDYQALFGTFDEKVDLQITNEENDLRASSAATCCRLPDIPVQTPIEHAFDIYQDDEKGGAKREGKAKLKLRKELIREMSIEEAMGRRIAFN